MANKTIRILVAQDIDGLAYLPNQLVLVDGEEAKNRKEVGLIDDSKASIAYCNNELGQEVINHVSLIKAKPEPDAQTAAPEGSAAPAAAA